MTTPIDAIHVVFLAREGSVHKIVADLKSFFAELKDTRVENHLHSVVVDPNDVTGALAAVQRKIDAICARHV